MTNADINDLETRDYIFKIGDRGKGIQARYDENTDALIFPRVAFDYVYKLLKETLEHCPHEAKVEQDRPIGHWILDESDNSIECDKCKCTIYANDILGGEPHYCPNCGAKMKLQE